MLQKIHKSPIRKQGRPRLYEASVEKIAVFGKKNKKIINPGKKFFEITIYKSDFF